MQAMQREWDALKTTDILVIIVIVAILVAILGFDWWVRRQSK
jgi:hypothetical protein